MIQEEHARPIYNLQFNTCDLRHRELFATVGSNRVSAQPSSAPRVRTHAFARIQCSGVLGHLLTLRLSEWGAEHVEPPSHRPHPTPLTTTDVGAQATVYRRLPHGQTELLQAYVDDNVSRRQPCHRVAAPAAWLCHVGSVHGNGLCVPPRADRRTPKSFRVWVTC